MAVTAPSVSAPGAALGDALAALYDRYNRPEFVYPDPLAPVLAFDDPFDQEVAGLVAAGLAFGNVKQILNSIDKVFTKLPSPRADLLAASDRALRRRFRGFRHRYVRDTELVELLAGIRRVLEHYGTLGAAFNAFTAPADETILPALTCFTAALRGPNATRKNYLLPDPARGSACKRLLMYCRWMIRRDAVDPGPWEDVDSARLVVPLDTHMHRMARRLQFTRRNAADLKAALEVTAAFRRFSPADPVRYDFALTRLGIRSDSDPEEFLAGLVRPGGHRTR